MERQDSIFQATSGTTVISDVAESYSVIIFVLDLTHSDGIKHTLAVRRMPVVKLGELPLLQRGVQNLAWQPHRAIARWFT